MLLNIKQEFFQVDLIDKRNMFDFDILVCSFILALKKKSFN